MPTTELPERKHKAAEISRRITNARPLRHDPDAPEGEVTGGFNQKRDLALRHSSQARASRK